MAKHIAISTLKNFFRPLRFSATEFKDAVFDETFFDFRISKNPPISTTLLLFMSLRTGSLRINVDQFGCEIMDFADRAMRLRCCSENEAWRLSINPLLAVAAALAELFEPPQHLHESVAYDLSWPELAHRSGGGFLSMK